VLTNNKMNVINLGNTFEKSKRIVASTNPSDPVKKVVHSLASCNDLRLEESNHLKFRETKIGLTISVLQQYLDNEGENFFQDIFKIKIDRLALREILLLQSIFFCKK